MCPSTAAPGAQRPLPPRPSLEHLRNEARQRHRLMQQTSPAAKLSEAQFIVAREYGFASWRALKAEIEAHRLNVPAPEGGGRLDRSVGFYLTVTDHAANGALAARCSTRFNKLFTACPRGLCSRGSRCSTNSASCRAISNSSSCVRASARR